MSLSKMELVLCNAGVFRHCGADILCPKRQRTQSASPQRRSPRCAYRRNYSYTTHSYLLIIGTPAEYLQPGRLPPFFAVVQGVVLLYCSYFCRFSAHLPDFIHPQHPFALQQKREGISHHGKGGEISAGREHYLTVRTTRHTEPQVSVCRNYRRDSNPDRAIFPC